MPKLAIKERPILFSAPMIRALLEGRKTQTRRIVKPQPEGDVKYEWGAPCLVDKRGEEYPGPEELRAWGDEESFKCPYGQAGDRLWVKETFALLYERSNTPALAYRADDSARIVFEPTPGKRFTLAGDSGEAASTWRGEAFRWRPSIFMPRWASRLTLEITDVSVQRVEEISEADAKAEGVTLEAECSETWNTHYGQFLKLFYDINKRAPRGSNPWVWALTFKVLRHA